MKKDIISALTTHVFYGPQHIFRPHAIEQAVHFFLRYFKGNPIYAVKTNPEPYVLEKIYASGIKGFDVASIEEVRLIRSLFSKAELYFMHTVKSRQAIKSAYHDYHVRDFSLDTFEELDKIRKETNDAKDLNLYMRIAVPNSCSEFSLAGKFGVKMSEAVDLFKEARKSTHRLGISFHVGSQCMDPEAYRTALQMASKVMTKAKISADMISVGGGFPSIYPMLQPPPLKTYFDVIHEEHHKLNEKHGPIELMGEPGRAIVAESGSVLVRVDLRKGKFLYINDGTYGSLFDAGVPNFTFPTRVVREKISQNLIPFSFFGPTCDSLDFMRGPFYLPDDIVEGEHIEIGQLGAYSRALSTRFNGFGPEETVLIVEDPPLISMYPSRLINAA